MKLFALLFALIMLVGPALALTGTGDFSIWGTNASNANSNITRLPGNNQSVNVSEWAVAGGTKTFTVNVTNTSDVITMTLYNVTAYTVYSLLVNSSAVQAYQANSTGAIVFSRTQLKSNQTYKVQPAVNMAGYNMTWLWVNGSAINVTGLSDNYLPLIGGTITGTLTMLNGVVLTGGSVTYGATGLDLGATSGATNRVVVSSSTNALIPAFVSTSRPAYTQGGIIFNTTTNSPEYSGDNNAWVSLNHFRNITGSGNLTERTKDTVYQNANSTPMSLHVTGTSASGTTTIEIRTGTTTSTNSVCNLEDTSASNNRASASCIIPPMHYYFVSNAGSANALTVTFWHEVQ